MSASGRAGFVRLWEFRPAPGRVEAFVEVYGPEGAWARLFAAAEGFVGTMLLRDGDDPERFVTIDLWSSREAFDAFQRDHGARYAALDDACAGLTSSERCLGELDAADAAGGG